jgi:hypothetical protein
VGDDGPSFHFGSEERECVRVWQGRAEVRVGEFSAVVSPYVTREDLVAFRDQLKIVHRTLAGTATFADLETRIELRVTCDPRGHVEVRGVASGDDERLEFRLPIDQSFLAGTLEELDRCLARGDWPGV